MEKSLGNRTESLNINSVHPFQDQFATAKMIYIVTYDEMRYHSRNAKRLILVESNPGLELERVTRLVKMLTDGNFAAASVEIAGQRDWDTKPVRHPAIRTYRLD